MILLTLLLMPLLIHSLPEENTLRKAKTKYSYSPFSHRKLIDTSSATENVVIPNQYVVALNPTMMSRNGFSDVQTTFQSLLRTATGGNGKILYTYEHVFLGALLSDIPRSSLITLLNKEEIEYATPNKIFNISAIQQDVVWGLDRIDQNDYPLSDTYQYNYTGKNVSVFVFDTGIKPYHAEFLVGSKSRVQCFFNAFYSSESCSDFHGHGTHVAGTIGGRSFGVAKQVQLKTVKVCDTQGSCPTSGILAGLDKVIARKKASPTTRMVINISLGGSFDTALNTGATAAVDAGIFVAVAAGNEYDDACLYSPSSASKVFTVGSISQTKYGDDFDDDYYWSEVKDYLSWFTNTGECVDIFAPGSRIISASIDCRTCSEKKSGTSMASPHVAGAAALYYEKFPLYNVTQVTAALKIAALVGKIHNVSSDTVNLLLYANLT